MIILKGFLLAQANHAQAGRHGAFAARQQRAQQ